MPRALRADHDGVVDLVLLLLPQVRYGYGQGHGQGEWLGQLPRYVGHRSVWSGVTDAPATSFTTQELAEDLFF